MKPKPNPEKGVGYGGSKCMTCGETWPKTTFRKLTAAIANGEQDFEPVCDRCLDADTVRGTTIDQAIEDVQAGDGSKILERRVSVIGIKSGTNLTSFEYATHRGMQALVTTDVVATFSKDDILKSAYRYKDVPVVVCEAWYAAPSKGGYFAQFVKTSYPAETIA